MLTRPEKDRVCVGRCLIRQRRYMKAAENYVSAPRPIMIGNLVCPISVGDIDLNDHQVGFVVQIELLNVFILKRNLQVRI